jgi:hypothetical protein
MVILLSPNISETSVILERQQLHKTQTKWKIEQFLAKIQENLMLDPDSKRNIHQIKAIHYLMIFLS